ncbi:MAG TPA: TauD/TfdA family dioxygenase, partial [Aquella sp.]|nr:TauD/TfdA family dioxygenase [Aquella sp.]
FFQILQHSEWFYNGKMPKRLAFFCMSPPEYGGSTIIANNRAVTRELPQSLIKKLIPGFLYKHKFSSKYTAKGMKELFKTNSENEAYEKMKEFGFEVNPKFPNQIQATRTSFIEHPITKERLLAMALEYTNEYTYINGAFNTIKYDKHNRIKNALILFFAHILKRMGIDYLPVELTLFEKLTKKENRDFSNLLNKNKVYFKWQKDDLLLLDNFLTTHGRQAYSGERKIVVSLSDFVRRDDISTTITESGNEFVSNH